MRSHKTDIKCSISSDVLEAKPIELNHCYHTPSRKNRPTPATSHFSRCGHANSPTNVLLEIV